MLDQNSEKFPKKIQQFISNSFRINSHYFKHVKPSGIEINLSFFFIQNHELGKFINEIFITKSFI